MERRHKVIINADDYGISKGVNRAIDRLIEAGIVTSTSAMSNMPYFKEVLGIKEKAGIGIHFNLTTGVPVTNTTNIPSLINTDGQFYDLVTMQKRLKERKINQKDIELEFDAQVKKVIDLGIKPDHINSHSSILKQPFLMKIIIKIAHKYSIDAVRTFTPRKFDYKRLLNARSTIISLYLPYQKYQWKKSGFKTVDCYDSLIRAEQNSEIASRKLMNVFNNLPDGVLEFVVHPGYYDDDTTYLGSYIKERAVELNTLLSDNFRILLKSSDIELISFAEI